MSFDKNLLSAHDVQTFASAQGLLPYAHKGSNLHNHTGLYLAFLLLAFWRPLGALFGANNKNGLCYFLFFPEELKGKAQAEAASLVQWLATVSALRHTTGPETAAPVAPPVNTEGTRIRPYRIIDV